MQAMQPVIFGASTMKPALPPQFRTTPFDDSRTGRRNRRLLAAGGAISLHLVLLCAFMSSNPGGILAADGGAAQTEVVEPYVVISLSGLRRQDSVNPAASQPVQETATLAAMMARMRQAQPEVVIASAPTPQKSSLSALFDAIQRERSARDAASGQSNHDDGGRGADSHAPDVKPRDKMGPHSLAQNAVKASAGAGGLWGFLEPCWRKLPGRSTVSVSLEVTLNSRGTISTPPRIVRPSNTPPDEARLVAEARAIEALSHCLPYQGPEVASGAPIVVEFFTPR